MNIVIRRSLIAVLMLICAPLFAAENSPAGIWKTIDDKTDKPKSLVEIVEKNGALEGRVIKLFRAPEEDQNPLCDKCEGERHNQPVMGMTILWGLKRSAEVWDGGQILDPKNGKVYSSKLKMIDNGQKLDVRGFIGFSLLGRTQTWVREP